MQVKNIFYHILCAGILLLSASSLRAQTLEVVTASKAQEPEMKVVSIETSCSAGATIFVENKYWQINVKTSKHNKVKLETSVSVVKGDKRTDANHFAGMNVSLKGTENQVVVKSENPATSNTFYLDVAPTSSVTLQGQLFANGNQVTINPPAVIHLPQANSGNSFYYFDSSNNYQAARSFATIGFARPTLTVYIPSGASLEVESKYGDIIIEDNVKNLKAYVNNATLSMKDVGKAFVRTNYVNINTGNIKDAELDITHGKMVAGNMDKLVISSTSSDIELHSSSEMQMKSMNDQYEIDQVTNLTGHKDYGSLRISNVQNSFDVTGVNGDIKIRHIETDAVSIKINNRFADIRLPVTNLENYSVEYEGQLSSIYAPFDVGQTRPYSSTKFKTVMGDSKKKSTGFVLKCTNCTIDFR